MILVKEFEFDAAHHLTKYHGKCEKPHGHTYKLVVKLEGEPDFDDMIFDFVKLKEIVKENLLSKLDHSDLNDMFDNPSAERIAVYVWDTLLPLVKRDNCCLYEVEVWETKTSGILYRGK